MLEIAIALAIAAGIGSFWYETKSITLIDAPSVVAEYHPYQWMGEDQDAHVRDWRDIGPLKALLPEKIAVLTWADFPLPTTEVVGRIVTPMASLKVRAKKKKDINPPNLVENYARQVNRYEIRDRPMPFRGQTFSGLSIPGRPHNVQLPYIVKADHYDDPVYSRDTHFKDTYIEEIK